jgi:hypothetical protein
VDHPARQCELSHPRHPSHRTMTPTRGCLNSLRARQNLNLTRVRDLCSFRADTLSARRGVRLFSRVPSACSARVLVTNGTCPHFSTFSTPSQAHNTHVLLHDQSLSRSSVFTNLVSEERVQPRPAHCPTPHPHPTSHVRGSAISPHYAYVIVPGAHCHNQPTSHSW